MAAVSFVWNTNIAAVTSCAYAKWGCCETKTKEMTLSNKRDPDTPLNELKLQPNTWNQREARENLWECVMVCFGFTAFAYVFALDSQTKTAPISSYV